MRAGGFIVFMALVMGLVCYVSWHLWRLTPAGWPLKLTVTGLVTIVLSLGGVLYHHKYREEMTIVTDKPLEKPLTIVLASDLHTGYHNRKAELGRWGHRRC